MGNHPMYPPYPEMAGAKVSATESLAFDAKAGFISIRAKGTLTTIVGPSDIEYCVKVNFPKGLLPPGQMIMSKLDEKKTQIAGLLNSMPHTEVTVDGNEAALFTKSFRVGPDLNAVLMFDATPVGFGFKPPAGGAWDDAILKFSGWATGAGNIEEESCVQMSATEFFHNQHANQT